MILLPIVSLYYAPHFFNYKFLLTEPVITARETHRERERQPETEREDRAGQGRAEQGGAGQGRAGQGRMVYLHSTPQERLFRLPAHLPTYEDTVADRGLSTAAKILYYRSSLSTIYFLIYEANHDI